jgi:hypothetical protein
VQTSKNDGNAPGDSCAIIVVPSGRSLSELAARLGCADFGESGGEPRTNAAGGPGWLQLILRAAGRSGCILPGLRAVPFWPGGSGATHFRQ